MQEKGANIPDYVVDDRVQTIIREEFGNDRAAFVRTLQAQGYSVTRFKEIEKEKIVVQAMRQAKINEDFVISPTQIQTFYDKEQGAYALPEQIKLRMIVLREGKATDVPGSENKSQTADEIRQKLVAGAESPAWPRCIPRTREPATAAADWGWIERNTLNEQLSSVCLRAPARTGQPGRETRGLVLHHPRRGEKKCLRQTDVRGPRRDRKEFDPAGAHENPAALDRHPARQGLHQNPFLSRRPGLAPARSRSGGVRAASQTTS